MDGRVKRSIEVEAPVSKVYEYWRNLENLPAFMKNIEEVRSTGPDTTHWVVKGPLGYKVEFDARTTRDEIDSAIGWNAVGVGEAAMPGFGGEARFEELAPGRTRVEVTVDLADGGGPEGSGSGSGADAPSPDPEEVLGADLERFAEIVEGSDPVAWAGRERSRRAFGESPEPSGSPGTDFDGALLLLESWEADESSDDADALAELKEGLDRDRTSHRKLFPDG